MVRQHMPVWVVPPVLWAEGDGFVVEQPFQPTPPSSGGFGHALGIDGGSAIDSKGGHPMLKIRYAPAI